jgi:hypothetical protein
VLWPGGTQGDVFTINGVGGDGDGNFALTKSTIDLAAVENKSSATIRGEITSGNVTTALGFTPESSSNKGATNGYAPLVGGVVPSIHLPMAQDDVQEFANLAAFPVVGETGAIYIAADTGRYYRWTGSTYFSPPPSPGTTDDVPEGAGNLYFTAARVRAALLDGVSFVVGSAITATDSVLSAFGKLQKQITDTIAALALKEDEGVADALLAAHVSDPDPHTQYADEATVNASLAGKAKRAVIDIYGSKTTAGSFTWTKAADAVWVTAYCIGSGGSSGSGRKGAAGGVRCGGGGGSAGGRSVASFPAAALPATVAVTVSAGPIGGASQTANSTNGNAGSAGQASTFGTFCGGRGGFAGGGGTATAGTAGAAQASFVEHAQTQQGAGAAASGSGGVGAIPSVTTIGPSGGGSGGGITSANAASAGTRGGQVLNHAGLVLSDGGAAGPIATNGANGIDAAADSLNGGSGGGGGGSSLVGNAGNGGEGGFPGGGGGGGGAAVDGVGNSGAGGKGANGLVAVATFF